jgi:hypothetical protein
MKEPAPGWRDILGKRDTSMCLSSKAVGRHGARPDTRLKISSAVTGIRAIFLKLIYRLFVSQIE